MLLKALVLISLLGASADCGERKKMLWKAKALNQKQASVMVLDDRHVAETWVSRNPSPFFETWTIFLTDVTGRTCIWRRGTGRVQARQISERMAD